MNAYYFPRDKTAVSGALKAPATIFEGQISAAKFVEDNCVPYNFLSFEFSATASEQIK